MARLKEKLEKEVKPALMERFGYRNVMEVPTLKKIVINIGVGDAVADPKALDGAVADLMAITGQRPVVTRAKKSGAAFKIRTGMRIGAKVTLRGERMYHFLDKLINVSLPRIRDFRGLSPSSFDVIGNYSFGIREQLVFPEIIMTDRQNSWHGYCHRDNAKTDEEGYESYCGPWYALP